jgi:hypothetical protein
VEWVNQYQVKRGNEMATGCKGTSLLGVGFFHPLHLVLVDLPYRRVIVKIKLQEVLIMIHPAQRSSPVD